MGWCFETCFQHLSGVHRFTGALQFSSFPSIPSLTSLVRPWLVDQWFQECSLLISAYVFTGQQIMYIYIYIYNVYLTQQLRQCRRRRESSATFRLLRHVGGALLKPIRDLSWPGKHRLFNASDWRKLFLQFYRLTILAACVHSHFISPLRSDVVIAIVQWSWVHLCPKTEGSVWLKQRMHKEAWFPCHVLRSLFQMCDLIFFCSFHRAGTAKSLDSLKGPKVSKSHIGRLIFSSHPPFESVSAKPYII